LCFVRHSRGGGAFNSRRLVIQFFLCFCSSFPHALSGNPVPLLLICLMAHPFVFPLASVRAGYFLLLVQEKVTKENTPREPRPSRFALRVRKGRPDSPDRVARRDAREFANGQEAHRANPGLPLPRLTGPRIKSNGKSKSCFASAFRFSLLRAGRARSSSSRGPMALRRQRTKRPPQGVRARDRVHSAVAQDVQSAEPGRWRGPDAHDARRAQGAGACFFGSFLCTSKERNPLGRRTSGSLGS